MKAPPCALLLYTSLFLLSKCVGSAVGASGDAALVWTVAFVDAQPSQKPGRASTAEASTVCSHLSKPSPTWTLGLACFAWVCRPRGLVLGTSLKKQE